MKEIATRRKALPILAQAGRLPCAAANISAQVAQQFRGGTERLEGFLAARRDMPLVNTCDDGRAQQATVCGPQPASTEVAITAEKRPRTDDRRRPGASRLGNERPPTPN